MLLHYIIEGYIKIQFLCLYILQTIFKVFFKIFLSRMDHVLPKQ